MTNAAYAIINYVAAVRAHDAARAADTAAVAAGVALNAAGEALEKVIASNPHPLRETAVERAASDAFEAARVAFDIAFADRATALDTYAAAYHVIAAALYPSAEAQRAN